MTFGLGLTYLTFNLVTSTFDPDVVPKSDHDNIFTADQEEHEEGRPDTGNNSSFTQDNMRNESSSECSDPDIDKEYGKFNVEFTYLNLPTRTKRHVSEHRVDKCSDARELQQDNNDLPAHYRSVCPWEFTIDTDRNRYPDAIPVVSKCLCDTCINSTGPHKCQLVYNRLPVLRITEKCVDGLYVLEPSWVEVPVACGCGIPWRP